LDLAQALDFKPQLLDRPVVCLVPDQQIGHVRHTFPRFLVSPNRGDDAFDLAAHRLQRLGLVDARRHHRHVDLEAQQPPQPLGRPRVHRHDPQWPGGDRRRDPGNVSAVSGDHQTNQALRPAI
jgi:hypothetical protein